MITDKNNEDMTDVDDRKNMIKNIVFQATKSLTVDIQIELPIGFPVSRIMLPIYIISAVFGIIFILGPLLVKNGENKPITQCCIMMTAFCMWIFWVTVYISQMNPLIGPRLHNFTLAWMAVTWGDKVKNKPFP